MSRIDQAIARILNEDIDTSFMNNPPSYPVLTVGEYKRRPAARMVENSDGDLVPELDTFHFLTGLLIVDDDLAEAFENRPHVDDSMSGTWWLKDNYLGVQNILTYNFDDSYVAQTLSLTFARDGEGDVVVVEVHKGDDPRCGYTTERIFRCGDRADIISRATSVDVICGCGTEYGFCEGFITMATLGGKRVDVEAFPACLTCGEKSNWVFA